MTDDENSLAGLDLEAWSPAPLPTGFADRVIARVHSTDQAVEAHRKTSTRRWLLRAGVAAVVASAAIALIFATDRPATEGTVVADRAKYVELDRSSIQLDAGASITWKREGDAIHVTQRAGAATYRATQPLVVDVDGVAIDATNSTLRVEAKMNLQDAKVIGTTAVIAATVALVTVAVYEGHAKLTSGGQTVVVNPGNVVAVQPNTPAPVVVGKPTFHVPTNRPAEVNLKDPRPVTIHDPIGHVSVNFVPTKCSAATLSIDTTEHDAGGNPVLDAGVYNYEMRCDNDNSKLTTGVVTVVKDAGAEIGTLRLPFDTTLYNIEGTYVAPATDVTYGDVRINRVDRNGAGKFAAHVMLVDADVAAVEFLVPHLGTHVLVARGREPEDVKTVAKSCNAAELLDLGVQSESRGEHSSALDKFEKSYACKADGHTVQLAFMSACNAASVSHARKWWRMLSPDAQFRLKQICLRTRITEDTLNGI